MHPTAGSTLRSTLGCLAFAAATAATAADTTGCAAEPGTSEDYSIDSPFRVSFNGDLTLLGGYNELFDSSPDANCVGHSGDRHARVSDPTRSFSIDLVRTKQDLADKLGVDVSAGRSFGGFGVDASSALMQEFTSASNSVSYLLTAEADYVVRDNANEGQQILLNPRGKQALAAGPATFAQRCGTHYIKGVRYGARLYLLITYRAQNHGAYTKLVSSLGIDGAAAGSGELTHRLEHASNIEGVTVEMRSTSSGYWLDAQATSVIKQLEVSDVGQSLAAATDLYANLTQAVELEFCRDSGQGDCAGQPSPGYFNRSSRATAVTGVQLAGYHTISNVDDASTLEIVGKRVKAARDFLEAYGKLDELMDSIYNDEVLPILEADPSQRAFFNVAPPSKPYLSPDAVHAVAVKLEDQVAPSVGVYRQVVRDRIAACIETLSYDITRSCTAGDVALYDIPTNEYGDIATTKTQQYEAIRHALEGRERISGLNVVIGDGDHTHKYSDEHCAELANNFNDELAQQGSTTKVVYRLPTAEEVALLAPILSHGPIPQSGNDLPFATWYAGNHPCGINDPYFQNDPVSGAVYGCLTDDLWDDDLVPLCVPANGPLP